jgi:lantibiotic modifying enzyme
MTGSPAWAPLCDGPLGDAARAAIADIAAALRDTEVADSTLTGHAGIALLYGYLLQVDPDERWQAALEFHLDRAIDGATIQPLPPALHGGFAGTAWVLQHVQDGDGCDGADAAGTDSGAEVDDAIRALVARPWTGPYDLIAGLVGLAVYALERLPRPGAIEILGHVVDRLGEQARETAGGLTWWSDPRFIGPASAEHPDGYYNLGLAHGVPGAIAVLGHACAVDATRGRARPLLDGAVRWLLAQHRAGADTRFAHLAGEPGDSRTAWCYGDPGIATALLGAARHAGVPDWERAALDIALAAAARPIERTGIRDAGLCHGTAGIAHIFNRLYRATGRPELAAAARRYLAHTLELRRPGAEIAGYIAHEVSDDPAIRATCQADLLTGAAGIGLALLAATTAVEPAWDRVLLTS